MKNLKNFPFDTFNEFRQACLSDKALCFVDRNLALSWAAGEKKYKPKKSLYRKIFLLSYLDWAALLGFVVYVILSGNRLLLLGIPVILFGFIGFHPAVTKKALGLIVPLFKFLTIAATIYSFVTEKEWLLALSITLLLVWASQKFIYDLAVKGIIMEMTRNEQLLREMWQGHAMSVKTSDNKRYFPRGKIEEE